MTIQNTIQIQYKMIILTARQSKYGPITIENTQDGSAVNVGGYKFDQYSRYAEGAEKIPDGDYSEVSFVASKFRDAYQIREIIQAIPLHTKKEKSESK